MYERLITPLQAAAGKKKRNRSAGADACAAGGQFGKAGHESTGAKVAIAS